VDLRERAVAPGGVPAHPYPVVTRTEIAEARS
jgi:hypothetical protein